MGESLSNSIVEYFAEHEGYKCGYCKSPNTNYSHGMWAHALTASDYQDLIDRGWRRSGKYCYKPTMDVTCCPMYTIRCRAQEFKPSKSQKKIMKRLNKYLSGDGNEGQSRKMSCSSDSDIEGDCGSGDGYVEANREHQDINISNIKATDTVFDIEEKKENNSSEMDVNNDARNVGVNSVQSSVTAKPNIQSSVPDDQIAEVVKDKVKGPDPTKGPCKKAKLLRKERKLAKLKESGKNVSVLENNTKNKEKQVEDFIADLPEELRNKLEIRLVRTSPPSAEYLSTAAATHAVYAKYQMAIHGDKPEKCSESHFKDFLVQSPILESYSPDGPRCGYGSFHQQYWAGGKLAAVGVIDILPHCVSSVYFFYDPEFTGLSLGTYGALREIAFTRALSKEAPDLKYYYMGYYIHTCPKMRYKGNFAPSDLLCPETYNWFPIKQSIEKLEASPYSRLDPDIDNVDEKYPSESVLNYIPVLFKGVVLPYKLYKRKYSRSDSSDEIMQYAGLVGDDMARSLILVR